MDGVEELEDIFPEIKESKDEGIRKFIIDCIDELRRANAENADFNGCCSEAIAYLEKQKYKERYDRMAPIYEDKESFESALDKAWEFYNESASATVDGFEDNFRELTFAKGFREGFLYKEKQKEQKSIEDAAKEVTKDKESAEKFLKTAGIVDENGNLAEIYRSEQEPAEWSEADDAIHTRVLGALGKAFMGALPTKPSQEDIEWFKSLPERFNLHPKQGWSEEDEKLLDFWLDVIDRNDWRMDEDFCKASREFINRLKSLRPRPHTASIKDATKFGNLEYERGVKDGIRSEKSHQWKPNEEQMGALFAASERNDKMGAILNSLYNDLKKL